MKNLLFIIRSSLYEYEGAPGGVVSLTAWRLQASSLSCLLDGYGHNTGYVHGTTLEEFTIGTGIVTGVTKVNSPIDPNHIADYVDLTLCPLYVAPPAITAYVFTNRGAPCDVVLTNNDGNPAHIYFMTGVLGSSTIPIAPGTYGVLVTPNVGGSPHAIISVNALAPVTVAAGVMHAFAGVVAPIVINVNLAV
ncbi:MAG TPA: hypothetical protein VIL78_00660 [Hanamia sp.]